MATSPNFNWPEPDNTDLVKNGALAIRTAVDAIDSSMVDLKGGTTGQILSKASNTDMDFTWVADAGGISPTIVDAKGDLIAATAADTPARLAVGTNGQVVTADSTASTGLAYTNKGWTLLSTTSLSGASVVLSSIPQTYQSLKLVVTGMTNATADGRFRIRPNAVSAAAFLSGIEEATVYTVDSGEIQSQANILRSNSDNVFNFTFDQYWQTSNNDKSVSGNYFYVFPAVINYSGIVGGMVFTGAITSITLLNSGGNFSTGTAYLYGVA